MILRRKTGQRGTPESHFSIISNNYLPRIISLGSMNIFRTPLIPDIIIIITSVVKCRPAIVSQLNFRISSFPSFDKRQPPRRAWTAYSGITCLEISAATRSSYEDSYICYEGYSGPAACWVWSDFVFPT